MTLNIDLILEDNKDNSKIDIYGRVLSGTLRIGDTFELISDDSTKIKMMVERIKRREKYYPVALANQNVEIRFIGINVDKIDTQCDLTIPTNEEKEKADTTTYLVFNSLIKHLETSFKEENVKIEFLTDFNQDDNREVFAKAIKDDTEIAVFCDKKVIFHKSCFIFQTNEWIEIKYTDIKKTGCTIANPADHFYVETDEYKYIFKNGIVNRDNFDLLMSNLSVAHESVNEHITDGEDRGTYTIFDEERQRENETTTKWRIKPVYYNKNMGIKREYIRDDIVNEKKMKNYKLRMFDGQKTISDDYSKKILHFNREAARNKYKDKNCGFHMVDVDHIIPAFSVHKKAKKSFWGQLCYESQLKEFANKDYNFAITSQKINRSKKEKTNMEYVKLHECDLSSGTKNAMLELGENADKRLNWDMFKAGAGNLATNAAIAATTDAACSLFDVIPEEWNAVKYGQKTKMEAFKDGAKKIGKSAGVAALTSTVIVVGEALGRKFLNSLFEE